VAGTTNAPTEYTARFVLPDLIERGRSNTLRCPVYRSAAVATCTAGTVTVLDAGGTSQVDEAAVTIVDGIATYAYSPATTLPYGEGWEVRWTLTVGGETVAATNDAALVRARLRCPVTDQDLYQRVSGLDPNGANPIHSFDNFQSHIELAWQRIERRLIERGNRPNLITSPSAFFDVALNGTLALIFEDMATRLNTAYADIAKGYRSQYEDAWRGLRFLYASTDNERADGGRRQSATPPLFACSRR